MRAVLPLLTLGIKVSPLDVVLHVAITRSVEGTIVWCELTDKHRNGRVVAHNPKTVNKPTGKPEDGVWWEGKKSHFHWRWYEREQAIRAAVGGP